jgi:hypothetical protein
MKNCVGCEYAKYDVESLTCSHPKLKEKFGYAQGFWLIKRKEEMPIPEWCPLK